LSLPIKSEEPGNSINIDGSIRCFNKKQKKNKKRKQKKIEGKKEKKKHFQLSQDPRPKTLGINSGELGVRIR
jgi:hypothetical protein